MFKEKLNKLHKEICKEDYSDIEIRKFVKDVVNGKIQIEDNL